MEPGPNASDRDARLLGLALLHGYVEADQLQRAAEGNSSPSRILAELRRTGALDDPCLEGLAQALKSFQSGESPDQGTASTHMEPPRHLSPTAEGKPAAGGSWDDDLSRLDSAARLLRQFSVDHWKHYRNLRFIGEGGMGRIYRAQDPDLKRIVALKFLRGQDPNQLKRFLFEAQAQALMDHPNICRVYEISEWQGQHYIAMQYVNGPTLLRAAPSLDFQEKLRIGEAVAEAVHAAHRRGLIHRDLKPANVLLERGEDGRHKPFVLDFGLAREMEAPGMTASGLVLGTTAYISPEQARGEAHHVDRRTDVYGLGATLYELFAGCPPFGDAMGMACIQKVLEEEPPPLRRHAPQLPKDLETVVMKCLEKDPARRYDDAHALAEDLRRVREEEPIQAVPVSLGDRVRRYARKNRPVVAAGFAALLGIAAFGGVAVYTRATASIRERHILHFSQEAERIEAQVRYAKLLPTQNIEPHLARCRVRLEGLQKEVQQAGRLARGPGAYAIGRSFLALGEIDTALDFLRMAEAAGPLTPELAYAIGKCQAFLYRRELNHANRMDSPEERQARTLDVEATWKVPALRYLLQSEGSSTEPREYLEAMIESLGTNLDSALGKVRVVAREHPLLYEAKRLEGEILESQARRRTDAIEAKTLLMRASDSFMEASRTASSDPDLCLGLARVHREMVRHALGLDEGNFHLLECRKAAEQCGTIRPSDRSAQVEIAWALAFQSARYQVPRRDPEPLIRDGLAMAEHALQQQPANPEGLGVKIHLLEVLGQTRVSKGEDPTESLERAVACAQSGLKESPNDSTLLSWALQAVQSLLIHQGNSGRDIEPAWRLAMDWADRYRRRHPQEPFAFLRSATLHIERAEWERTHGKDPRPSIDQALGFSRIAEGLGKETGRLNLVPGNALLIRGQYSLVHGLEAAGDFEGAAEIMSAWLRKPEPLGVDFGGLAESLIYRGLVDLVAGRNPSAWIDRAEAALTKGLSLTEDFWLFQLRGECSWVRARWAVQAGQPPAPFFNRAQADLLRAARHGDSADAHRWVVRLIADKAEAGLAGRLDLVRGQASALRALRIDSRSGEAHFLAARLAHAVRADGGPAVAGMEMQPLLKRAGELDARFLGVNLENGSQPF